MRIMIGDAPFSVPLNRLLESAGKYDDRGFVIAVSAYLDDAVSRLIDIRLIDCTAKKDLLGGGNAPIGSFSARTKLARVIGCITEDEYKDLNAIRRLRNDAAHNWEDFSLENNAEKDRVGSLCLPHMARLPASSVRDVLMNRVVDLLMWFEMLRLEAGHVMEGGEIILDRIGERTYKYEILPDDFEGE